jgi:hypothetical protein
MRSFACFLVTISISLFSLIANASPVPMTDSPNSDQPLMLSMESDLPPNINRSPAIEGPATDMPQGENAFLYLFDDNIQEMPIHFER